LVPECMVSQADGVVVWRRQSMVLSIGLS